LMSWGQCFLSKVEDRVTITRTHVANINRITQVWVRQLPTGVSGHGDEASVVFARGLLRALNGDSENDKQQLSGTTIKGSEMVCIGNGKGT
jgi:hypothetical protein